jgi:DNA-binding LacI/PurR family transcriptional regulator
MPPNPTLKDIAKKTGLAVSTVSRGLRAYSDISPATRERIRQAAEALGYHPDPLMSARAMRLLGKPSSSAGVTTIAFVTNFRNAQHPYQKMCLDGATIRANELGYRLEHFPLDEKNLTGRRLSQILYARGIRGICIAPLAKPRGHLSIHWDDFACAAIGHTLLRPVLHRAASHHFQGILLAMRELRRLGHQKIGVFLSENSSKQTDDLSLAGALVYSFRHPNNRHPILLQPGKDDKSLSLAVIDWFRRERPDAVIGHLSLKKRLEEGGVCFPEDASFVNWNYLPSAGDMAGIDQRTDLITAAAIDLIVAQIQSNERGIPSHPKTVLMPAEWRPGATVRRRT